MISTLYASMNLDKETNVAIETTSVVSLNKPLGWRRDKCQIKQQCEEGKVLTEQRLFNLAKTLDKCCLTESTTDCVSSLTTQPPYVGVPERFQGKVKTGNLPDAVLYNSSSK